MKRRHATEPDDRTATLCGLPASGAQIDNTMTDCKRCLRAIAARTKHERD